VKLFFKQGDQTCDKITFSGCLYPKVHPVFPLNREQWEGILANNSLDEVEIRDNRYNQV